ncbi:HWE histidine kinase domain-containing protein [Zavarzinia sp. CC-PAN008]|uniref:HWE histidine kinase domain-containing protein n=1 Tax=Zavarzinia sp. CC-PAN008 TaxID=3243332 RepID=UPI003F743192
MTEEPLRRPELEPGAPVDLSNCDREPIHIPGRIQPHGVMLVCEDDGSQIAFASEGAAAVLGLGNGTVLGRTLGEVLGPALAHDLRNASAKAGGGRHSGMLNGARPEGTAQAFDIVVHRHDGRMIVELEPAQGSADAAFEALEVVQALVRRISSEHDVTGIAAAAARLARVALRYDRVMVYRFLHNAAGRVIAEAKRPAMHSFLGQHFPAADIPAQARRLYLDNWLRQIGDINAETLPLTAAPEAEARPVDLSFAHLRAVSPVHCEYLRNMGVAASLSISIVVDGRLWGLIVCHHDSPRVVPMATRVGAELFGRYVSSQIAMAERQGEMRAARAARERLDDLVHAFEPDQPLAESLSSLLAAVDTLVPCDGAALYLGGRWTTRGTVPDEALRIRLAHRLAGQPAGQVWSTTALDQALATTLGELGSVAGALAIPLSLEAQDYLVLFRNEEAHSIEWAGVPSKDVVPGPLGPRLTPRGSFDAWREDVRGQAQPWTDADRAVAEAVRTYLRDVVLRYGEFTQDERHRAERQYRVLNDELNHRIKNILALVKSLASQTAAHADTVAGYSAALEGRLLALSFAHDQALGARGGPAQVATLVEAEASATRDGQGGQRVAGHGPAVALDDRAFGAMALVLHEMMTNAAKYGALAEPGGRVAVSWALDGAGNCVLDWVEQGGPRVVPPTRQGFGSALIQATLGHDLGGSVTVDYAPDGLRARLVIPAAHVRPVPEGSGADPAAVRRPPARSQVLHGLSVLLVEDQALIAMDIEMMLRRLGAREVQSVPDRERALAAIQASPPDVAVLDYDLQGVPSDDLADALAQRAIPFAFATGYGPRADRIPARFAHVPVVRKPIEASALADRLAAALAPPEAG